MLMPWKPSFARIVMPPLLLMSAACLTACDNWRQVAEQAAQQPATTQEQVEAKAVASAAGAVAAAKPVPPRPRPDIPKDIQDCLDKAACTDAKGVPKPDCKTADGIVVAHVQTEKERQACKLSLLKWWQKQQALERKEAETASVSGNRHPQSGKPAAAGEAKWP